MRFCVCAIPLKIEVRPRTFRVAAAARTFPSSRRRRLQRQLAPRQGSLIDIFSALRERPDVIHRDRRTCDLRRVCSWRIFLQAGVCKRVMKEFAEISDHRDRRCRRRRRETRDPIFLSGSMRENAGAEHNGRNFSTGVLAENRRVVIATGIPAHG